MAELTRYALPILAAFFVGVGSTAYAAPNKVQICHIPPNDPNNFHTITVGENTLSAHLAHGDLTGPCDESGSTLCDDGNACTIDAIDPLTGDCAVEHPPVDCSDQLLCTTDSCDPFVGCQYAPINCDDGDLCTVDVCSDFDGQCTNTPIDCGLLGVCLPDVGKCDFPCEGITCDPIDQCHEPGVCILPGECVDGVPVEDGTPCNDGNPESEGDQCINGVCAGTLLSVCEFHQSDWSVHTYEPDITFASAPDNQLGWNRYYSADGNLDAGDQLAPKLVALQVQERSAEDFSRGTLTDVAIIGSGEEAYLVLSEGLYGTYESALHDFGKPVSQPSTVTLSWVIPSDTALSIKIASSKDGVSFGSYLGPDCSESSSYTVSGQMLCSDHSGDRYFKWFIEFSSDGVSSPNVSGIAIEAPVFASPLILISSPFNTKQVANKIAKLSWIGQVPPNSDVELQLRTASDLGEFPGVWGEWLGPTDATDWYGDPLGGEEIHPIHRDGIDDQWLQYRVRLTTNGAEAPRVSQILVYFYCDLIF